MKKDFDTRLANDLFPEMPQSCADGLQRAAAAACGSQDTRTESTPATGSEPKQRRFPVGKVFAGAAAAVLVAACVLIVTVFPGIGKNKESHTVSEPRELNKQTLLGVWKETRRERAVDPSPFESSTYEAWEYVEWEKSQTWEEEDSPMIPEYLEFTADGRMYKFFYASDGGVQFNQSSTYTISGDIILWTKVGMPMRYEAETDTICWILPDSSREFYERASETEIVDPYRQKLSELRKQYPEYFGIDTFQKNLLKVYVWQMAENDYSCALVSGREVRSEAEIGMMRGVTIEEMRMILSTYYEARDCNIEPENVKVIPFRNPISSYAYEIDEAYTGRLRWLLTGIPFECDDPLYSAPLESKVSIYDDTLTLDVSTVCDVDGDGRYETCMLTYGPTSGLFTFTLSAYRDGTAIYRNTFQTANGYCHLQRMKDGLNLYFYDAADTKGRSTVWYAVTIENGMIVLTNEKTDETVEYWGLADPHWNMKGGA